MNSMWTPQWCKRGLYFYSLRLVDTVCRGRVDLLKRKNNKHQFIVDTRTGVYDMYEMREGKIVKIRSFLTPSDSHGALAKDVRFAEQGKVIVAGSDYGQVYVFDRHNGRLLATLSMGSHCRAVQHVAVCTSFFLTFLRSNSFFSCSGRATRNALRDRCRCN